MGFLTQLFSSRKKEKAPPVPTIAELQQILDQLASETGAEGTAALAMAARTADQMQAIVVGLSNQTDAAKRFSDAMFKWRNMQTLLSSLKLDRINAGQDKFAAGYNSYNDKTEPEKAARRENVRLADLKLATIDVQLSLVSEAIEKIRPLLPAFTQSEANYQ